MDGDIIEIDAAMVYTKDYCALDKNGVTIRGVGNGRAKIDAMLEGVDMLPDAAIWTINGKDTVIENVELTGAKAPALNGTGIHVTGENVTIRNSSIHDNEYGIRVDDSLASVVLIEASELGFNGTGTPFGDSVTVGNVAKLTIQGSYLHNALGANLITSFAAQSFILYNRITDEADGSAQYQIHLPEGGATYIIGNSIHKGPKADPGNNKMISFADVGGMPQKDQALFVVNNTFVSEKDPAGTIFIDANTPPETPPVVRNNIFVGTGTPCTVVEAVEKDNNITNEDPLFEDAAAYNYRLKATSPAIDKGVAPGMGLNFDLTPKSHYVHPAALEDRPENGPIDVGAFEFPPSVNPSGSGGAGGAGGAGVGGGDPGSGGGSPTGTGAGGSGTGGSNTDDDGCSCRTGERGSETGGVFVALGLALLYGARRRKNGSA